jgi:UDP-glucose 4-epimerase
MDFAGDHVVVTGGAGFVGSHLADRLASEATITVVDDCSNGKREWVHEDATFLEGDLTDPTVAADAITADVDVVCHFAAAKAVDAEAPRQQFEDNVAMTYNVLERMDEVGVDRLLYTSSSTVYGEAPRPTPEDYGPLAPISPYGAGKAAEEGLISTYANSHGIQSWVFRFANIVGPRLQPGAVIPDFILKLRDDPSSLEILGDGRQEKSYMHITDCVDAMRHVATHAYDAYNPYNLGTQTATSVTTIAELVADEMGLDPEFEYTGGDRGWTGDVPRMRLAIERLTDLGFEPDLESDAAVRRATRELLEEL